MVLDNLKNPDLFSNIFTKKSSSIRPPTFSQIESLKEKPKLKVPIISSQISKLSSLKKPEIETKSTKEKSFGTKALDVSKKISKAIISDQVQTAKGFLKGAKETYSPLLTPIIKGRSKVKDIFSPGTEGYKDFKEGYTLLGKGALKIPSLFNKISKSAISSSEKLSKDPIGQFKKIKPLAVSGGALAVSSASKLAKSPETRGKASFFVADIIAPTGLLKSARLVDKSIRSSFIKLGAKEVPSTKLFSSQIFKDGEITSSLVKTTSPKKQFLDLESTKGLFKEYPEHYVIQTSRQSKLPKVYKTLTKEEKKALKIKIRNEDPSEWYSVYGHGNIWALRLPGQTKSTYKFSLLPKLSQTAKPEIGLTLTKRAERLPLDILKKDKGFKEISKYQDFLSTSKPSTTLFPKRSEVSKIGYPKLKKLIKKVDPKVPSSSEEQFVKIQNIITQPAKKLKPKKLIGKLKGYDEYVKVLGQPIPIRKEIISGASIYRKGARPKFTNFNLKPLYSTEKGFINMSSKPLKNRIYDVADRIGESSYFKSINRSKNSISNIYRRELQGSITEIVPPYSLLTNFLSNSKTYKNDILSNDYSLLDNLKSKSKNYFIKSDYKDNSDFVKSKSYNVGGDDSTYKLTDPFYDKSPYDDPTYKLPYPVPVVYYKDDDDPYDDDPTYKLSDPFYKVSGTSGYSRYNSRKSKSKKRIDETKAYKPYVRTKGKWTEVKTKKPVNFYEAKKRGFQIADRYAERSVKLVPTNKKAKIISRANPLNAYKFRKPKTKSKLKNKFIWIEKSKYAIDSKGELNQITYKGLKAKKKKNNFL